MNKKGFSLLIVVVIVGGVLLYNILPKSEPSSLATEEEVLAAVEAQYEGSTIQSIQQKGSHYQLIMDHQLGEYELIVDGMTKEMVSLRLLTLHEDTDNETVIDESNVEIPKRDSSGAEPQPTMLTKEEAIEIALSEVAGTVDDVELEVEDGIVVYEIEIEVNDDEEATILINAYTGQVLSVTWD